MQQRPWTLAVWCVGLVAGTVLFHSFGSGALSPPPWAPAGWPGWVEERGPVVATVSVLRLLVLGLCWYLVGVTTIGVVARLLRAARLVRVADAVTVPWLRRLLQQGLGVTLAAAMMAGAVGPAAGAAGRSAETVVGEVAGSAQPAGPHEEVGLPRPADDGLASQSPRPAGATLRELDALPLPVPFGRVPDVTAAAVEPPTPLPERDHPASSSSEPVSTGIEVPPLAGDRSADARQLEAGADSYLVRSGDSFWRIAEQRLTVTFDRAPSEGELVAYWQAVIEENRGSLPNPDDPDLILPGQQVVLPAVPEA